MNEPTPLLQRVSVDVARDANFAHRQNTLSANPSMLDKFTGGLTAMIERQVVRVSRLPDAPVYSPQSFEWVPALCDRWRAIRHELDLVLRHRDRLPKFQDILPVVQTICRDGGWKTYWLFGIGMDCRANQRQCPETTQLLRAVPGLRTAFFSILAPGKHIPTHRGAYNGLLRFHLALKVPQPEESCRIRIANQMHHWREGEALIFDDTFQHEVWNDTGGERVVLFVDFERPLRQPWHWLNARLLDLGHLAPFLRAANVRQRQWADRFHGVAGAAAAETSAGRAAIGKAAD